MSNCIGMNPYLHGISANGMFREGKKEMNEISKYWSTLTSDDFRVMKQKLGV